MCFSAEKRRTATTEDAITTDVANQWTANVVAEDIKIFTVRSPNDQIYDL